ncbi:MAG: hypothetical protein ACREC6_08790, partial [Hyphomicrobiaceae bacterium]
MPARIDMGEAVAGDFERRHLERIARREIAGHRALGFPAHVVRHDGHGQVDNAHGIPRQTENGPYGRPDFLRASVKIRRVPARSETIEAVRA